ncbi:MAG: MraY family glycosyltransferase [bacterium]
MQMLIIRHMFTIIFSFLLTFYIIPLLIRSACQLDFLDQPDGKIKVHKKPIPYLGGFAVYCGFIAPLCVAYPFVNKALWLLLGVTFLLFLGLIDDLKAFRPGQKFFGQIFAVLCFLKGGFSLKTDFFSSGTNLFLSALWMLSVINAFNLVDVMDGLTSTIAFVAASTFFIIALLLGQYEVSLLLIAFMGAILAFFWYNKPAAKMYLGDSGSMFIGGFLSALPLLLEWSDWSWDAYYAPAIILGIPLLEVFFLVVIRTRLGIPFYKGSPHHFSIYLQNKGWSKYKVLGFVGMMGSILSGLALLFLFQAISFWMLVVAGIIFFSVWCFFIFSFGKQKNEETVFVSSEVFDSVGMSAKGKE